MAPSRLFLSGPVKGRTLLAVGLLAAATALSGCGNMNRDDTTTGAIPDDYRTRHPIVLNQVEHAIDLPISGSDSRLTVGMRDTIGGFASAYKSDSSAIVQIMLPSGSANAAAARHLSKDIRRTLINAGVPSGRIVFTAYQAGGYGNAAPVRLSYVAMTASTAPCGQWPEDLANDTFQNRNWENFGCSTQANLAAQIANPTDLLGPRKPAPIDAERRGNVIEKYRSGANTATAD
ncbi:CpaD family pilus assembly protein [Rhizobium halophytocola]|uniref:Pilus assembly protein CpaD n=1 Tax=Rhizobium halophytocola TaxID=735519 RepID=A0ABS4E1D4_9HYPH|nr:CpaD family pilus assembly protein [Rhizobium halophytocola]MBP1851752.1 pilus assembly protein CpaD [Rhizobium halophytocola]